MLQEIKLQTIFERVIALVTEIECDPDINAHKIPQISELRNQLRCSLWEAKTLWEAHAECIKHFEGVCTSDSARAQFIEGYYISRRIVVLKGTPGAAGYMKGLR